MNNSNDENPEIITPNANGSYVIEDRNYNINIHEFPETTNTTTYKVPLETTNNNNTTTTTNNNNNRIIYKNESDIDSNNMYIQNSPGQSSIIDNNLLYEAYKYDVGKSVPMDNNSGSPVHYIKEGHNINSQIYGSNKYATLNVQNDNTVSYNLEKNDGWNMSYVTNTEPNISMNYTTPPREKYQSSIRTATLEVPMNRMNESSNYNQTLPINSKHNGYQNTYPNVETSVVRSTNPNAHEASVSAPYNYSVSPTAYNLNTNQEMSSLFRKTHGYTPPVRNFGMYPEIPNYMNFPNPPVPYGNHGGVAPMSPQMFYLKKETPHQCFLKRGVQSLMNACNKNNKKQIPTTYKYIMNGPTTYPTYPLYEDPQKFDVFKKMTLRVGTCLDDVVNLCIDTLGSSLGKFNHNNEVNLQDLYPFYNPDPVYTRPERPTLKTGNNFIDNINGALDATTLVKHTNVPNGKLRIPIPQTQKTGFVVVDGVNKILDNLLNDPISYRKYDYYNDRINGMEINK